MRIRGLSLNGGLTDSTRVSYEDARALRNSSNNAWRLDFSNGNLNNNNNNKYNNYRVRPVVASRDIPFLESVIEAYNNCIKNKRTAPQAIEYVKIAAKDVPVLAQEILENKYYPSTSTCFMVTFPKLREVFAANFRDRIVHHWICLRLNPLFEKRNMELGDVSHACRKGHGTRSAVKQVSEGIDRVSRNMQRDAWIYKGDIVGFFMNIDRKLLWKMLRDLILKEYKGDYKNILLRLVKITIFHRPEEDCIVQSDVRLWENIRKDKSLFYNDKNKGEPIGNLTTQLFAGYYLSFLDEFVKSLFKGKNYSYTRLVDDYVIICDDKEFLKSVVKEVDKFLQEKLFLETHKGVYFQHVSHGVKFVGKVIKYRRTFVINRTIGRMITKLRFCLRDCRKGLTSMDCRRWQSVLNSYIGLISDANSYRKLTEIREMLESNFFDFFFLQNRIVKIKKIWR